MFICLTEVCVMDSIVPCQYATLPVKLCAIALIRRFVYKHVVHEKKDFPMYVSIYNSSK